MKKKLLEICCDHLHSALAAQAGGADRIELCAALATDGLTPSMGLLQQVKQHLKIPVFVLIRCRPGSFVYDALEIQTMLSDIEHCKKMGADGIVGGALLEDGSIDLESTAALIEAARPLPFTFHKAFDLVSDPIVALDQLIELGTARVLTSGQAPTAVAGKALLQELAKKAGDRLHILCAGGIRDHNIGVLLHMPGIREFHSAALHSKVAQTVYPTVDENMVRRMQQTIAGPDGD
jgi:copper homeostasis protein